MSVKITKDGEEYIAHANSSKSHKYIQKIPGKNGKFTYVYPKEIEDFSEPRNPGPSAQQNRISGVSYGSSYTEPSAQQNRVQATGGNAHKTGGSVYGSYNPTNMKRKTVGAPGGSQSILQKKASGASTPRKTVGAPGGGQSILQKKASGAPTPKIVGAPKGNTPIIEKYNAKKSLDARNQRHAETRAKLGPSTQNSLDALNQRHAETRAKQGPVGAPKGNTPILKQGPDYFRKHTSADTSKKTSSGPVGAPKGNTPIIEKYNAKKSLDARNQRHAETRAKLGPKTKKSKTKEFLDNVKTRLSNVLSKLKIKKKK